MSVALRGRQSSSAHAQRSVGDVSELSTFVSNSLFLNPMATPINVQPDAQMAWLRSHPAFQPTISDAVPLEETQRLQHTDPELPPAGKHINTYLDYRQAYKHAVSIQ